MNVIALKRKTNLPPTQLYLMDARRPLPEHLGLYSRAYEFWHSIWNATFTELNGHGLTNSDNFFRQDEICVLASDQGILGLFCFSWFDLFNKCHADHSYFQSYPEAVLRSLKQDGVEKVMTMGYLSVAPEWRKTSYAPFVSEILVAAACKRLVESDAQTLITFTRNNRKMNELGYRHGARCLLAKQTEHNVEVDFIGVFRDEVKPTTAEGIPALADRLWRTRTESFAAGPRMIPAPRYKVAA